MSSFPRGVFVVFGLLTAAGFGGAVPTGPTKEAGDKPADTSFNPHIAKASDEGQKTLLRIRKPKDLKGTLWAAEPMLANPVCFCFDEKGRCYVAETFRMNRGVTDNRAHMYWVDDDVSNRTVAERVAMYRKYAKENFKIYETEHERIKLIEDTTGAGVADKATLFADGWNTAAEGLGAGLLARRGNVYYTCIPDLWLLRDTKGTGKADVKQSFATGFGVHVALVGHDMHGLRMGPDGRLYFSIGDRGFNVTTKEGKHLFNPDSGAVLRCDPDGSNLEVFATGLRNPQELAFDAHGNLFTVDNNSDSGDRARLVYIVQGGDSGWREGYQYGSDLSDRGLFNAEKIWHLAFAGQTASIVPPLAHLADGPSGFCYNYGAVALPDRYAGHFFLADFRGGSGTSGIRAFNVKPKGAAFQIDHQEEFVWSLLATDCEFGPDGGFYVSDWTEGWELPGKGRIYRFANADAAKKPAVGEVKTLLPAGFTQRSIEELTRLLGHADQRVRQEAQFALTERGAAALVPLEQVAHAGQPLARLHAIWGLGQLGRKLDAASKALLPLLTDAGSEVRAQAANVLGDIRAKEATPGLVALLADKEPRVRYFAAQALGRIGSASSSAAVFDLLRNNADQDPYLRHAGVLALAGTGDRTALLTAKTDPSASVRLGAVLALRRLGAAEVAQYLDDGDAQVALEAARAIHDDHLEAALPALATRLGRTNQPELLLWRALNARYRLGRAEDASAAATLAANPAAPEVLRIEALQMLGDWSKPVRRDRVTGLTQNLGTRDGQPAIEALRQNLGGIFTSTDKVRQAAASVAAKLGIKEVGPALLALIKDRARPSGVRVESFRALAALQDPRLDEARAFALADGDPRVRTEGLRLLARTKLSEALPLLAKAVQSDDVAGRQGAYAVLAECKGAEADALVADGLNKLLAGQVPLEVRLDLLEAAAKHPSPIVQQQLAKYESSRRADDHLAAYRETLAGGDAEAGRRLFAGKAELSCVRCHKVRGEGGEVGPELTGVGTRQTREYLLESIVEPNKQIAKGFETLVIELKSGKTVVGVLKAEDANELRLITAEGTPLRVVKSDISERQTGKSAMPEDLLKYLTKAELRDLVEYLASLK